MTERVTVEQNGERFTLEVPDGTSDNDIQSFLTQQTQPNKEQILTPPPEPVDNIAAQAAIAAKPIAQAYWEGPARGGVRDIASLIDIAKQVTPDVAEQLFKRPLDLAKAYFEGHPWYGSVKSAPGRALGFAGRAAGGVLTAPENAVMMPYNMAAYEQAKIRMNPNALEYANNPYAMQLRGEVPNQAPSTMVARQAGPTQNIAGAKNQRSAVRNFSTAGNPNISQIQQYQAAPQQAPAWIQQAMDTYNKYARAIGQ
jgi:hypothetical protein